MAKEIKEPGRIRQLWDLYKLTAKTDKKSAPIALGVFAVLAAIFLVLAGFVTNGNPIGYVLYGLLGVVIAGLTAMILMSRRAEKVAYSRIEGQPGAVGAILDNGFRGGWITSSQPIAMNPRTKDLLYRVIGPAGIVLIGEGHRNSLNTLINDERRKLAKIANGVPLHTVFIGRGNGEIALPNLRSHVVKLKRTLNRREIRVVDQRLSSMGMNLAIPKGIDPTRMRGLSKPR